MSVPTKYGFVTLAGVNAHLPVKGMGESRGLAIKVSESLSEQNKGGLR
jgi:hypothetical protein